MPRLRIVGLANGEQSVFDGTYVQEYDPSYRAPGEPYDGGKLVVTDDPDKALVFENAAAALDCWRQSFGMRADGKPNRPLTAYTVEVVP